MAIQVTENCIRNRYQWSSCHRCVSICPEQAVEFGQNFVINTDKCSQCERCISACPFEAIENNHKNKQGEKLVSRRSFLGLKEPEIPQISEYSLPLFQIEFKTENCNLCGLCEKYCPNACIKISTNEILINAQHCHGCQLCADICQLKAMRIKETEVEQKEVVYPIHPQQCSQCGQPYQTMMKTPNPHHLCPTCTFRKQNQIPIYKIGQTAL